MHTSPLGNDASAAVTAAGRHVGGRKGARRITPVSIKIRIGGRMMLLTWRVRARMAKLLCGLLNRLSGVVVKSLGAGIPLAIAFPLHAAAFAPGQLPILPTNPTVANGNGNVTFSQGFNTLTITQTTDKAIVNWDTFSTSSNARVQFIQPSASSAILNRVMTNNPSSLLGTLTANGRVWLINPAGIMVGVGARIDVAGFVASSLNVQDTDFLAGRMNFQASGTPGPVQNYGAIATTPEGGNVYLIGTQVENHGVITAPGGEVLLAAGQTVQLLDTGTPGVSIAITGAAGSDGNVTNLGQIISEAGRVGMGGVLVTNRGVVNANGVQREGGRIFLKATQNLVTDAMSSLSVDGTAAGSISLSAGSNAQIDGRMSAQGSTGVGGTVETGGGNTLSVVNPPEINSGGEWKIAPLHATIQAAATGGNTTPGAVYSSGDTSAVITTEAIQSVLNRGANVTIASGLANLAGNFGSLTIATPILKNAGTNAQITFASSNGGLAINADVTSTSGQLNMRLDVGGIIELGNTTLDASGGTINAQNGTVHLGAGKTATIMSPMNVRSLNLSGGTLNSVGGVTVTQSLDLTGGTLTGSGGLTTTESATSNIAGIFELRDSTWLNSGQAYFYGGETQGKLLFSGTGAGANTFTNLGSFLIQEGVLAEEIVGGTAPNRLFDNRGNFTKSSGAANVQTINAAFQNSGSVTVNAGSLRILGSGTDSGTYQLNNGSQTSTLDFGAGTRDLRAASPVTGPGTLKVSGGTVNVTNPLVIGNGTLLAMTGGALNLSAGGRVEEGAVNWSGGIINAVSAPLSVSGVLDWSGGTLVGAGGLDTLGSARTTIASPVTLHNSTWNNAGAVTIAGAGALSLLGDGGQEAVLVNRSSGVITDTSDISTSSIHGQGLATASFYNNGRFIKDAGTISTRGLYNLTFNNSGAVEVRSGALDITGNGFDTGTYAIGTAGTLRWMGGVRDLSSAALVNVGSGATLEINNATVNVGAALNVDATDAVVTLNSGTLNLQSGGTIAATVNLVGGTVIDNGGLNISGVLNWANAAVIGGAVLTTRAGAVTNIVGSAYLNDKTWNNAGTVNLAGATNLLLGGDGNIPAAINNQGVFNVGNSAIGYTQTNLNKRFQNTGTFNKSTLLASDTDTISVPFYNSGIFSVASGTAVTDLHNLSGGTLDIARGATLRNLGGLTNETGAVIRGSGTLIAGNGSGTIVNNGDIVPGSADAVGKLTLQGNFSQGSTGRLNLRLADNSNYDRVDVSGNVALDGTLVVSTLNGYAPIAGDSFVFLTLGGGRTGTFSSTTLPTNLQVGYSLFAGEAARLDYVSPGTGIKYFDNGVGDFDWSKPVNWTGNTLPVAGNDVVIDTNARITHASGIDQIRGFTIRGNSEVLISGGSLAVSGPTIVDGMLTSASQLSLAGPVSGSGILAVKGGVTAMTGDATLSRLDLVAGTLDMAGNLRVNNLFNWSGGVATGSGGLITGPNAVTSINGTGTTSTFANGSYTLSYAPTGVTRLTNTTWNNYGIVNISGLLLMPGNNSGGSTVFNNQVGGVVNDISAQGSPMFSYYSGAFVEALHDTFNNAGIFNKTAAAAPLQIITPRFNNSGTTNITGRVVFDAGGTDAGTYTVASNSSAEFYVGTRNFETGTRVIGPGLLAIPGTVNINGAVTIGSSTVVNGGTLAINSPFAFDHALSLVGGTINAARPLTISSQFTIGAGTITGAGGIATPVGASTTISGAAALRDTLWNNGGDVYMLRSGQLTFGGSNATVFNNLAGAGFYDAGDGQSITTASSASAAFNNSGSFTKFSANATGADAISVPFYNTGTLNVASGVNTFNLPDGNRGSVNIANAATFGTINGDLVNQAGGSVRGAGTISAGGGSATLINNGVIAPGDVNTIGTLAVQGSLSQGSNGEIRVRLASGIRFDHIDVTGNVALDGKLTAATLGGYAPAPGDGFAFLSLRGQRSGVFAHTDLPINLRAGYSLFNGEAARLDYVNANPTMQYFDNGAGDFNWANPVNWSSDMLPTASQDVLIDTNARVTHASGTDRIRGFTIKGGSEVLVSGGSLGVSGPTAVAGKLSVAAGSVTLDGPVSVKGALAVQGGTLALNGDAAISSLEIAGGLLTGAGTLDVIDSFKQTGGALAFAGRSVKLRQGRGALVVGNIEADNLVLTAVNGAIAQRDGTVVKSASLTAQAQQAITLDGVGNTLANVMATATGNAPAIRLQSATPLSLGRIISSGGSVTLGSGGAISQTAGIDAASLRTVSAGGTILESANTVTSFSADNSGSGAIKLVNTSRPGTLRLLPVTNYGGGINIDNTGGVVTSGDVTAGKGSLTISAHSPITVNSTLTASDGINLNTFASPSGNDQITLTGTLLATGGGITLSGATNVLVASTATSTVQSGSPIDLSATTGSVSIRQGATFNGAIPNIREGTPSTPTGVADSAVNETLRTTMPVQQGAPGVLTLAAVSITGAAIINVVDAPTVGGTADNFGGVASESDAAREQASADPVATTLAVKLGIGADGKPLRALPVCN